MSKNENLVVEEAKNEGDKINPNRSDREKTKKKLSFLEQKTQKLDEDESLLSEDSTQIMSPTIVDYDKDERPSLFLQFPEFSKRVEYKRKIDDENNVVEKLKEDNDKTIRGEARFLKKIEKCKHKRLQRICVCPLDNCYHVNDRLQTSKTLLHRFNRLCFVACCPPCFVVRKAAFWPPRCEYFFYRRPPDFEIIDVESENDAIKMKSFKKSIKKYKKAKKCDVNETYTFGMAHPCANDVEDVEGFVLKTDRNNTIGCIYIKCPRGNPRFTLLYSHPNGSDISDHLIGVPNLVDVARFYHCDVYSYDYTGYGISRGSPSEKSMYSDIRAVFEHITVTKKVPVEKLVLLGYSIGSAVTIELIRQMKDHVKKPAGVILQAPPTSLVRVMGHIVGRKRGLEKETCCMDRFTTIDKMKDVTIPVLVIHGKNDKTVPIAHGELICKMAINRASPVWVSNGSHDNIENCREVWIRIRKFVKHELGFVKEPDEQGDEKL